MATTLTSPSSTPCIAPMPFARRIMAGVIGGAAGGVVFGTRQLTGYLRGVLVGLAHGAIWWVLGPLKTIRSGSNSLARH